MTIVATYEAFAEAYTSGSRVPVVGRVKRSPKRCLPTNTVVQAQVPLVRQNAVRDEELQHSPSTSLTYHGVERIDLDNPVNRLPHRSAAGWREHQFCVFPLSRKLLSHTKWDTYCPETFCGNCKKVRDNKVTTRWECMGHLVQ